MLTRIKFTKTKCNNYNFNHKFITNIRGLHFFMNILGLLPRKSSQSWYNLIWYFHSVGLLFQLFGPTAGLIVQRHDPGKIIENLGVVIPMTSIFIKWLTFSMHNRTVTRILYSMDEDWNNLRKNTRMIQSVPDSKRIMSTYAQAAKVHFFTYLVMLIFGVSNYVRDSLSSRNSHNSDTDFDKLLPVPNSWYPLDYNRSLNIQFLAVTQTFTLSILSLANSSIDSSFITLTLHLCGQFEILRYFIKGITYDSSRPESCTIKVRLMIKRHQVLLGLGDSIQESYTIVILVQLVASTLTICFLGYAYLLEMERNDSDVTVLLKTGFLCGASLQSTFSYCIVGDFLTNKSIAIAMAVYNAQWYNCTRLINRSFLIVMIRAKRPVQITGAKLLPTSLENFSVLMKTAASYLSVLRAMSVNEG